MVVEVVTSLTCMKNLPKRLENLKADAAQLGFDEKELEFSKDFFCVRDTLKEATGRNTLSLPTVLYSERDVQAASLSS